MNKFKRIIGILLIFTLFGISQIAPVFAEETEGIEAIVEFPKDSNLKAMDKKEKESLYKSLDEILTSPDSDMELNKLGQFKEITSDKEYEDFIQASKEKKQIILFSFQECPFCKAFDPKISKLAEDYGVTINYYDAKVRNQDEKFNEIIEFYGIDSVPHAFIVKDGKIEGKPLDSHSTMAEIEEYIQKVQENK